MPSASLKTYLTWTQLPEHIFCIRDVPMLGEFSVVEAPDIDGSVAELLSGRRKSTKYMGVGRRMGRAGDDLVAGDDAILHLHMMVRCCREDFLEELYLRRKAGPAPP